MNKYNVGDLIGDRFKLTKEITKGGMGSVIFLATDTKKPATHDSYWELTQKNVIVKIVYRNAEIGDEEWEKLLDESVTARRASREENVAKLIEIFKENNNTIIFVMEYVKGHSLRDIIEKNGYLNLKESLYIIRKVLEALKGLHNFKHKIIHRDLKPENIMISNDYTQIKIIDFGISSVIASGNKVLTLEESLYGTYAYISPEIFALNESTDKGSILNEQFDFFSIGVILYEMLLGTKPFYAEDYETTEALKLALNYDIYPMNKIDNNIPNAVENIIFKCLASKKEDKKYRYKKAEEIIHDIQKIEQNTKAAFNVKLIKPEHKRVYVARTIFKIDAEKQHLKIWYQQWFINMIIAIVLVIIGATILFVVVF